MNYDIVLLGDVCEFLDNQRVPITESDRKPGPYPYYGANGQQDSIDSYIFDEPLVLLAEDGGYFGSKDRPIAYKVTGKCWVNNHAHVLRPKSVIDIDYLHRVLSYYDVTKYINGTTRQKLTKSNAENISFPLPPLEEQKRIASLLARADRLRGLRRAAREQCDSLLQSVFLEMFGEPAINPKKWEVVSIGECVKPTKQINPQSLKKTKFWYVDITSIDRESKKIFEPKLLYVEDAPSRARKHITSQDILVSTVRPNLNAVAKVPEYLDEQIASTGFCVLRCDARKIIADYLFSLVQSQYFIDHLVKNETGANYPAVNDGIILEMPIPLPPLALQEEFARVVARVEALRARMDESARQGEALFQSLLAESFG